MRSLLLLLLALIPVLSEAGENRWTLLGPFGEPVRNFLFHPLRQNEVFANTHQALYRSVNGGKTWKESFSHSFCCPLVIYRIAPSDADHLLIIAVLGTKHQFFKSSDSGESWNHIAEYRTSSRFEFVLDFEFNPQNSLELFSISSFGRIMKSTDGGVKWFEIRRPNLKDTGRSAHIEINRANPAIMYFAIGRSVYKSADSGKSWALRRKGLQFSAETIDAIRSFAMHPTNPNVLYVGSPDGLYKTVNGGSSWNKTNCDCKADQFVIDRLSPQNVYVIEPERLLRSRNSGKLWELMKDPRKDNQEGITPFAVQSKTILLNAKRDHVLRSADSGMTWTQSNHGIGASVEELSADPNRIGHIFVTQSNTHVFESHTSGLSWKIRDDVWPFGAENIIFHPLNPNLLMFETSQLNVSTDRGRTWTAKYHPSDSGSRQSIALHPSDPNTLFFVSSINGIIKSPDLGSTRQQIDSGLSFDEIRTMWCIAVDPRNGSRLLVGTKTGSIYKTGDQGRTWKKVNAGNKFIRHIAFDTFNPSTAYAVTIGGIVRSTNSGESWTSHTIFPDAHFERVISDTRSAGTLFVLGLKKVWISTDAGINWSIFNAEGLPQNVLMRTLNVSPWKRDVLILGTARGSFSYTRTD